jgi:hypothetical protein
MMTMTEMEFPIPKMTMLMAMECQISNKLTPMVMEFLII